MNEPAPDRPLTGVLWMLATGLCFVAVNGIVRHLGSDLPAAQSAFIRFGFGLLFLVPALVGILRRGMSGRVLRLVLLRGVLHTLAVVLWFYAMARITLAEVTAIGYLNPIIVTLGAALLFGERLAARRIIAIAVAVLGTLVILRPGLREVEPGHWAQLGAAIGFGVSYLVVKRLTALMPASAVVAMLSLTVTLGLAPLALLVWVPVSLAQVAWLGLVAVFATLGHYTMARAFAVAPMTVTQPVTFLQLVWATLLGVLVFDEVLDPWVMLGGALIIGAVSYMTWREHRLNRSVTPMEPASRA